MQEKTQTFNQSVPYANVNEAVKAYASQWLLRHSRALVVPGLIVACLVGWAVFAEGNLARAWLQLLWVPVMIAFLVFGYFRTQGLALFYQGIASAWTWEYRAHVLPTQYKAALFKAGHSQLLRNMLSGEVGASPAFVANFQYTVGSGKSAHTYTNTVAMLALTGQVPHLLLAVDKDRFDSAVLSRVDNFVPVPLEGVFETRVGLYVESGFELEALQIMDVVLLEKLDTVWPQFSLEFVGSDLYVYAPRVLTTRNEVEQLLSLLQYASQELSPQLRLMQGSIKAMQEMSVKG